MNVTRQHTSGKSHCFQSISYLYVEDVHLTLSMGACSITNYINPDFIVFTKIRNFRNISFNSEEHFKMEYSLIEGKKLNSNNYECQSFRYIKSREHGNSIYLKCSLFRNNSCTCAGKINKQTNLLELTSAHNHDSAAYNSGRIIISNTVKSKAENSTTNLRELFNETCRGSDEASSVTFRILESSMYKRRRILQPKLPTSALEFDSFL